MFGLTVTYNDEVIHMVGYYEEPTIEDAESLRKELREDEEFELQHIADEVTIRESSENEIEFLNKILAE